MDKIIRCITSNGGIMAVAADSTYLTATAQQIHNTTPVATAALGRLLTGTAIMGCLLKSKDASITLRVSGGGPVGTLTAIADGKGNCRGLAEHPQVELPLRADGKLDVGGAVGKNGLLGVIRDYGTQPYTGQVELISGEIAEDITNYYVVSEQIPTACALGVLVDKNDHTRILAGGLLVQALPGADEEQIKKLEQNFEKLPSVTSMLAGGMNIEEICRAALQGFDMEILDESPLYFACNCSKARVERAIATLKPQEMISLADETGYAEATCPYCNHVYRLSRMELEALAKEVQE